MSEAVPVTADTKLRLEIEKLQAEIDNLRRPWIKNPATWVSLITIFVALCGLGFQYVNHQVAAAAATQKLEQAKTQLEESQTRHQATDELAALDKKLEDLKKQLAALPSSPQNQSAQNAVALAANSVKSLQATNNKTIEKATVLNRNLGRIKAGTLVNR